MIDAMSKATVKEETIYIGVLQGVQCSCTLVCRFREPYDTVMGEI
ncbi:hypothetical protein LEMLEM_LOCUS11164 [Lemmus lemmus]